MCPLCGTDHAPIESCPGEPAGSLVGQVVAGKYRIARQIGEGGMGRVYQANHVAIDRPFALKFIHRELAGDPEWAERFRQEAAAAGKLVSDHVAAVLDYGAAHDGTPYIAMEFLNGETLAARSTRPPALPFAQALEIVAQACRGVAAAHRSGIVHRDLKPENLFLCRRDNGEPLVKILDFGIAKVNDPQHRAVTKTGRIMGTPAYMSPEQARGETSIDERTDVYALGVILYELLTGADLFRGSSYNAVIHQVLNAHVPRLDEVNSAVSGDVADVVHRAISRDRHPRFSSAAEFGAALASCGHSPALDNTVPVHDFAQQPHRAASTTARGTLTRDDDGQQSIPLTGPSLRLLVWTLVAVGIGGVLFAFRPLFTPTVRALDHAPVSAAPESSPQAEPSSVIEDLSAADPASPLGVTPLPNVDALKFDELPPEPAEQVLDVSPAAPVRVRVPPASPELPKSVRAGSHGPAATPPSTESRPTPSKLVLEEEVDGPRNSELTIDSDLTSNPYRQQSPSAECSPPWKVTPDGVRRIKVHCFDE